MSPQCTQNVLPQPKNLPPHHLNIHSLLRKMKTKGDFHNLEKKHTRGGERKNTALFSFGSKAKLNLKQ